MNASSSPSLWPTASASPLPRLAEPLDDARLRAELSSYLDSLKSSPSVTLPDDFDALVDSLTAQHSSLPSSPDAPHWLSLAPPDRPSPTANAAGDREGDGCDSASAAAEASELLPNPPPQPYARPQPAPARASGEGVGDGEGVPRAEGVKAVSVPALSAQLDELAIGLRYSEEAELQKIAELDALLDRLTAAASRSTQPTPSPPLPPILPTAAADAHPPLPPPSSLPIAADDDEDEQTTFITAISAREAAAQQRPAVEEEEKEALTLPAQGDEVEGQGVEERVGGFRMTAGEGFTLTPNEVSQLSEIDALIAALQADEKAGKRRRFTLKHRSRLQRSEQQQAGAVDTAKVPSRKEVRGQDGARSKKGRGTDRGRDGVDSQSKLPSILPPPQLPPPAPSAPTPASIPAPSSYIDSLSALLDDCLSHGERQRLDDIEARLSRTSEPSDDAMAAYDEVGAGGMGAEEDRFEVFDADTYLKAIHQQPSLTVSSLSEWYGKAQEGGATQGGPKRLTNAGADNDAYAWMDAGLDADDEATRAIDDAEAANSVLPDSDDEQLDAVWSHLQSLAPAPDPAEEKEGEAWELLFAPQLSVDERAQAALAGAEAARQRVQRLMREAEERKRRLSGPATVHTGAVQGANRRVRTSDERKLAKASPQLVPLGKRPASAEATAATTSGGRRPAS